MSGQIKRNKMKKKKYIGIICAVLLFLAGLSAIIAKITIKTDTNQQINITAGFNGKVNQWEQILGTCERTIPTETQDEELNTRYPTYGTSLSNITDEEKDNILSENSLILASDTTYNSMDASGNLYLNGVATG